MVRQTFPSQNALYTPTKFDRDARSIRAHDQRRQRPNLRHRPRIRVPSPADVTGGRLG